jgi:hypothetical protein
MPSPALLVLMILSAALFLGLAALGWGSWGSSSRILRGPGRAWS